MKRLIVTLTLLLCICYVSEAQTRMVTVAKKKASAVAPVDTAVTMVDSVGIRWTFTPSQGWDKFPLTISSCANGMLMVVIRPTATQIPDSIKLTVANQLFTGIDTVRGGGNPVFILGTIMSPTARTDTIKVFCVGGASPWTMTVFQYKNVNQTNPFGTRVVGVQGWGTSVSINLTVPAGGVGLAYADTWSKAYTYTGSTERFWTPGQSDTFTYGVLRATASGAISMGLTWTGDAPATLWGIPIQ